MLWWTRTSSLVFSVVIFKDKFMRYAFIFPGQGSQSIGMGQEFYSNFCASRELLENSSKHCGIDFEKLLFTSNDKINESEFTQPAIVLNSFMAFLALKSEIGIIPDICLGHSLGEFSALGVSGGLKFEEAIKLVNIRGSLMQNACKGQNASMMVILGLDDKNIEEICTNAQNIGKSVWAANYNCDGQVVIAGNKDDLASLETEFKSKGAKRAMLLNMSVASHCPMLKDASEELLPYLGAMINDSFSPVISNTSAEPYTAKDEAIMLLKEQLIKPVLYKQSITSLDGRVDCYVEFGASVLKGMNKKITSTPTYSITDIKSLNEFVKFAKL